MVKTVQRDEWTSGLRALLAAGLLAVAGTSCTTAPTPFLVRGAEVGTNDPPSLEIEEPIDNLTIDQGSNFLIRWTDSDLDSDALISFSLVNTATNNVIPLVNQIPENDTLGVDSITIGTRLIPLGTYHLFGTIDDDENPPVTAFAEAAGTTGSPPAIITIVEPGQGPPTRPPTVFVTEPAFNLSVAQDDQIRVSVQPTALPPDATRPFDSDSTITLYILLDRDQNPNNDDPANPDADEIILLRESDLPSGTAEAQVFDITIDLATVPPRPNGEPYFIRATVDDLTNPRVHQYATGTISVVELASGLVDLFDIGRTKSGARFYGTTPGASLGSTVANVGDFDADNTADFVLVAQYGNPRNFGLVGEAYGVYGRPRQRFGGAISVASIGATISGVVFEGPPIRDRLIADPSPRSDGITDVSFIRDLTGDGRPELLFGMAHVHGAVDTTDYDPADQDLASSENTVDVEVVIRQGEVRTTEGGEDPTFDRNYRGVLDATISSETPGTALGSSNELSWQDNGVNRRQWALIKFADVLDSIPDAASSMEQGSLTASLDLRVFRIGADATLHQSLTNFTQQTTFSNYAKGGGEPVGGIRGDTAADYLLADLTGGGIGAITATQAETVSVDVSALVQQLLDGELRNSANNELRFIIVPSADEGQFEASVRASEYSTDIDRPTLTISYTRTSGAGFGEDCYPDNIVNNRTDSEDGGPDPDTNFFAGGMGIILSSQNRDNDGTNINSARLESTVVSLELVGERTGLLLDASGLEEGGGAPIFARADNSAPEPAGDDAGQAGRIAGARFVVGGFDLVDARRLNQPPREDLMGQTIGSIGDLNNDGLDEIIISAPGNELDFQNFTEDFGFQGTHRGSTILRGSIAVFPGTNYNAGEWRDKNDEANGTATQPFLDQQVPGHGQPNYGSCQPPVAPRHYDIPADAFEVFAENVTDHLGGAGSAGDFNQDGREDILCGAPLNDRSSALVDTGAVYILYGKSAIFNYDLRDANDRLQRSPMLRIRGVTPGDRIGWRQVRGRDVNGDRIDDVFLASPATDFGDVRRTTCARDFNGDGVTDTADLDAFPSCRSTFGDEVFTDDACKVFDFNNDTRLDDEDEEVIRCLRDGLGNCCGNLVDNGFVGILFGTVTGDGDRTIDQVATTDLPGVVFFGSGVGHRAGTDVSSAGDFNQDGFGDILIAAPGEIRLDRAGRERVGVVYLIFGGTHLYNTTWSLEQVGSADLPGIVFVSPYVKGRPNEAAPTKVSFVGDINSDGYGDIAIGNPKADFIDLSFPQGPDATDASVGRRRNAGDAYIVYGNNFGANRELP
ncbi:MAG: FG-GAP repeat protein [Planctomycetes bacterium]|nr:FG-GAP repeat protein [Planctomycetota bacterium]